MTFAQGTFQVHFDQSRYTVSPGGTVQIGVVMESVPEVGLFSYGVRLVSGSLAGVQGASGIVVPAPLDFNGVLGPGAIRLVENGAAGVKGTIDFFANPVQYYRGTLLATFLVKDLNGTIGTSDPLSLEIYRTLGGNESVFVDAAGSGMDSQIIFGSAVLDVVPEPRSQWLLLLSGVVIGLEASGRRLWGGEVRVGRGQLDPGPHGRVVVVDAGSCDDVRI
jgi:hypothetical protein